MSETARPHYTTFRQRLQDGALMFGSFVKMPTSHPTEILAVAGYDFVVIDQEHGSLDRTATETMILGARAGGIAPIVRVGDSSDNNILSVLDCGAVGIFVPHVNSVEKARQIARACRYQGGTRGYAGNTRAGGFGGIGVSVHKRAQDALITCIAMIEDLEAVDIAGDIARVEGIDALFIGRGDLTAALGGESHNAPETTAVVEKILAQARKVGIPVIMLATSPADAARMKSLGATTFMLSNDQSFLKSAASAALQQYSGLQPAAA